MKIVDWNTLPDLRVSHNAEIKKRTLINRGEIPKLMMYGTALFKPGQQVELHKHDTMFEVFHIQTGKAIFTISGKQYEVCSGNCITIEPGEIHGQHNPFDTDVTWIYFGIATD